MDREQTEQILLKLQRNLRDAQRELNELEELTPDYSEHVVKARQLLSEHQEQLLDLREGLLPPVSEKRSRGGQKQYYLKYHQQRAEYIGRIRRLFEQYYDSGSRSFRLADGTTIKAPLFLAYLYDIGIRDGLAAAGAPVKDFAEMVQEAARSVAGFTTAYNTIQRVIKTWRLYIGARGYGDLTLHLHNIRPEDVKPGSQEAYQKDREMMEKVAKL